MVIIYNQWVSIVSKGGLASSPAIFLSIPHNEELFPTITITTISLPSAHEVSLSGSRKTSNFNATETRKILGRFCAADIVNPSRHFIRAPMECTVYGLDGSLVLAPHESRATMPLTPPLSSQPPSTPQRQIQRTKPLTSPMQGGYQRRSRLASHYVDSPGTTEAPPEMRRKQAESGNSPAVAYQKNGGRKRK